MISDRTPVVTVENLTKRFGNRSVLRSIGFQVNQGELVGLLGPNGAGKSTTMNIITGLLSATSGEILVNGQNILENPEECKANIGYAPELPPVYGDMTVSEYLRFVCRLKRVARRRIEKEIILVTEKAGVTDVSSRLIGNLSKGYAQRVSLAQAMVGEPTLLILDEPTSSLDPHQIFETREVIRRLGEQHTVILSSHILQEVSALCTRIMIMNHGRIVANGDPKSLVSDLSDEGSVRLRVVGSESAVRHVLRSHDSTQMFKIEPGREKGTVEVEVRTDGSVSARTKLFTSFAEAGIPIVEMTDAGLSLEEVYLKATMGEEDD